MSVSGLLVSCQEGRKIMCFSGLSSFCCGFLCPFIWPVSDEAAGAHPWVQHKQYPGGQMRYLTTRRVYLSVPGYGTVLLFY